MTPAAQAAHAGASPVPSPRNPVQGTGEDLTVGSLCTGYGGLDMAVLDVLGGRLAWVADNDAAAAKVLAHHHPDVPNLADITAVDWRAVESVDVVAAGFPCQDISYAGRGAGIKEGTRSGLWYVIADAVGVLRPRCVVLENVAGIVARRPGLDVVLADLARLGFDAEWTCVRASDVGAPHRRDRWFLSARPADAAGPRFEGARVRGWSTGGGGAVADTDRVRSERDRTAGQPAQRHAAGPSGALADASCIGEREPADEAVTVSGGRAARPQPRGRSVRSAPDTPSDGRDEGWTEPARQFGGPHAAVSGSAFPPDTACDRHRDAWPAGLGGLPAAAERGTDWGAYEPAIRRWEHVTGRPAPDPTEPGRSGPRLNPIFVEWLLGLPLGHVTAVPGLTRNDMLRVLGNGVVPQQGAHALRVLLDRLEGRAVA